MPGDSHRTRLSSTVKRLLPRPMMLTSYSIALSRNIRTLPGLCSPSGSSKTRSASSGSRPTFLLPGAMTTIVRLLKVRNATCLRPSLWPRQSCKVPGTGWVGETNRPEEADRSSQDLTDLVEDKTIQSQRHTRSVRSLTMKQYPVSMQSWHHARADVLQFKSSLPGCEISMIDAELRLIEWNGDQGPAIL